MLSRLGESDPSGKAKRILALETRLATIQWDNVALRDREKNYNKRPASELARLALISTGRLISMPRALLPSRISSSVSRPI